MKRLNSLISCTALLLVYLVVKLLESRGILLPLPRADLESMLHQHPGGKPQSH